MPPYQGKKFTSVMFMSILLCCVRRFLCIMNDDLGGPAISVLNDITSQPFSGSRWKNDERDRMPNILLIFIENISHLQSILNKSPAESNASTVKLLNIERIRNQSILFDHVMSERHSSSSSATLLTGLPAVHTGMIKGKILPFTEIPSVASTGGLQYDHATLAESIKQVTKGIVNYVAAFVGYWKLGHGKGGMYLPHNRGFDFWTGIPCKHTDNCHGRSRNLWTSTSRKGRAVSHQYINLMHTTSPGWLAALIGVFSAYFLKAISWKRLIYILIYMFMFSLACFVFLKVYKAYQSASCLLYHMNEIIEQPYDMENMTLFFTQSVIHLLEAFHAHSKPFFLHVNYLKLQNPHFSSRYFRKHNSKANDFDSLLELDWSIGEIMTTMDELNFTDNTLLILTGSNNCPNDAEFLEQNIADERRKKLSFILANVSDKVGECLQVPLYLRYNKIQRERKVVPVPVSFIDIAPTILEAITNVTQDDYPGCSLLPLIYTNDSSSNSPLPFVYNLIQTGLIDEQHQHMHRCNHLNRLHLHYLDITRPFAVTIGCTFRLIFSRIDGGNVISNLKYPIIYNFEGPHVRNISMDYLEELYINVTKQIDQKQAKRRNKWSSQFEMPVYLWLLPCANFPRCEAKNGVLSRFPSLHLLRPGAVEDKSNDHAKT